MAALIARCSTGGTRKPDRSKRASGTSCARKASVTTATLADSTVASSAAAAGATSASRRAVGAGRRGQHDGVRLDRLGVRGRADGDRPARGRTPEASDRRGGPRLEATAVDDQAGQATHPAGDGREDRGGGDREAGRLVEERAATGHREQLRHRGGGREAAGVAGVHPAEQGLDQSLDHLVAEPRGDEVADRHVVGDVGRGLGGRARQPLRAQHPAGRELVEVEGDAHERARQRAQGSARPDPGRRGGRVQDLGAELVGQVQPLGAAGQHRLGADVDGEPGDLGAAQLPAELRGRLEQQHVAPRRGEPARGDQPGDSPTDDHHVMPHELSLGWALWTPLGAPTGSPY